MLIRRIDFRPEVTSYGLYRYSVCGHKEYGFSVTLAINRVLVLVILVINSRVIFCTLVLNWVYFFYQCIQPSTKATQSLTIFILSIRAIVYQPQRVLGIQYFCQVRSGVRKIADFGHK